MGKYTDIAAAAVIILGSIYIASRMGITLGDLVHDIKLFIYGSGSSIIIAMKNKLLFLMRR